MKEEPLLHKKDHTIQPVELDVKHNKVIHIQFTLMKMRRIPLVWNISIVTIPLEKKLLELDLVLPNGQLEVVERVT